MSSEEEIDLSDVERKGEEETISLVRETVSSKNQLPQFRALRTLM